MAYSKSFSGRQGHMIYQFPNPNLQVGGMLSFLLPMTEWNLTNIADAIDGTNFTSRYPLGLGPWNAFGLGTQFEPTVGSIASQEVIGGHNKVVIEARGYPTVEAGDFGGTSVIPLPIIGTRVSMILYPVFNNADIGTVAYQYWVRINSVDYNLNVKGVLEYSIIATTAGPPDQPLLAAQEVQPIGNLTPQQAYAKRVQEHQLPWPPPEPTPHAPVPVRVPIPVPTPPPVPTPEEV